jgi:hypothetical protein
MTFTHILDKSIPRNVEFMQDRFNKLDPTVRWSVNVEPFKSTRSKEQNSRLWKLYTELGKYIGESPDAIHELMGYKFLRELKTINGQVVEIIKSTTKLNTKQMGEYQDAIERWAAEIGFYFIDN